MKPSRRIRKIGRQMEDAIGISRNDHTTLRNLGWFSAGVTAVALGVVVGREIRARYKFNRRTPYDAYAHSGDQTQDVEFGLGV